VSQIVDGPSGIADASRLGAASHFGTALPSLSGSTTFPGAGGGSDAVSRAVGIGNVGLPAGATADAHLDVEERLRWTLAGNVGPIALPDRSGARQAALQNWDAIVGAKGRVHFGKSGRWFAPWCADIGAGESDLTWQVMGGVGHGFGWGDVLGSWRVLDCRMKSGTPIEDVDFNAPMISAVFRW
jgi:hypothetical protein